MKWIKENGIWAIAAIAAVCVLIGHAQSVSKAAPEEIVFNDFSVLNYQAEAARGFYKQTGSLWGYDPHFMAGFPLSFIWNSNIAIQWLAVKFPDIAAPAVVRAAFIWSFFLFPLVWWCALRTVGLSFRESAAAFVLGSLYFLAGLPALFLYTGMLTAGMLVPVAVLAAAAMYRYVRDGRLWFFAMLVIVPLAPLVHKTAILLIAPVWCAGLIWAFRQKSVLKIGGFFLVAIAAWEINLVWIDPLFYFMKYKQTVPEAPFWRNYDALLPFKEYFTGRAVMNTLTLDGARGWVHSATILLIAALAIAGAFVWKGRGERSRVRMILIPAVLLWLFVFYGSFISSAGDLNPTRYFSIVNMLFAIAGGTALAALADRPGAAGKIVSALIVVAALAGLVWLSDWFHPFRLLVSRPASPAVEALAETIKKLPQGGRIMIEDSGDMDLSGGGQVYGGAQLLAGFGVKTGREFIGGPYPYVFLKHRYASFYDGRAFGKNLSDMSPGELLEKLKLYDVKWIVSWSPEGRGYFNRYGGMFRKINEIDEFEIFETLDYEPNIFLKGDGVVKADFGKIIVTGARSEDRAIVLKYHWPDAITVIPKAKVEMYPVKDDPVGFIKVINPPENFVMTVP